MSKPHIRVYLDDDPAPILDEEIPSEFKLDTRKLADGPHRLIVRAEDQSGVEGVEEIPFHVQNGPGIRVSGLRPGSTRRGTVHLTLDAFSADDPFDPRRAEARSAIPTWVWVLFLGVIAWVVFYVATMWVVPAEYRHTPTFGTAPAASAVAPAKRVTVNTNVLTQRPGIGQLLRMKPKTAQMQIRVTPAEKTAIQRLAKRAGMDMSVYVRSRVLESPVARFAAHVGACQDARSLGHGLAELNTFLSGLSAPELADAVATAPAVKLGAYAANYIAAMVEYACQKQRVALPAWTRAVEPLEMPVFASALQSLRLHLLTHSPPPFRRRNIFIDASLGDRV